ncbi:TPA: hypothetical protein HLT86_15540 [Escherichia coli]|nr:hypothetical protein [Escherichia coli]HAJ4013178.1 hypothetical protein [Escherichia coli]HAJ4017776.1 hypothetical protein [Escherichia coli]HAJ4022756.1 hypothetical protein [Escherichia coli]
MLYGTGFEASMAVQLFKTLLNQIPLLSSLQSGTLPLFGYSGWGRPMKKCNDPLKSCSGHNEWRSQT